MDEEPELKSQPKKKRRASFIKLFYKKENAEKALAMIKSGFSHSFIAKILGCDRTSVTSFYQRKINEKKIAKGFHKKKGDEEGKPTRKKKLPGPPEEINIGKPSYADYLREEMKKQRKIQQENMLKAKKTIEELRKWRETNEIVKETWTFN